MSKSRRAEQDVATQELLDELTGIMATKGSSNPLGLLKTLARQAADGEFIASHAPRIQVEREGQQLKVELAGKKMA